MRLRYLTERLVVFLAPRNLPDFLTKLCVVNASVVLCAITFEVHVHGHEATGFRAIVFGVLVLSVPLIFTGLAAIWYLNTLRRELVLLATTDLLTGLCNRRAFIDAAERATATSRGVLLMIDLDHFKKINDTYGHAVGDECLRVMADVLRAQVRDNDIVGRLGGEEFGIFLVEAPIEAARIIGDRLSEGATVNLDGVETVVNITASVGAAEMPANDNLNEVLTRADLAMYEAKNQGRARLVFWEKLSSEKDVPAHG